MSTAPNPELDETESGRPSGQPPPTDVIDAVVVRLGSDRYAVPFAGVAEVGRTPAVSHAPGMPAWVAGVVNWRGRILAVLDIAVLLDPTAVGRRHERLVVLVHNGVRVGLLVDAIEATTPLADPVAPLPVALPAPATGLVSGHCRHDGGPVVVLDVAGVLRLRDDLPRRRTA